MIEKMITSLINTLFINELITEKDKEWYHYYLQVLLEKVISVTAIFLIAFIWDIALETLLFLICFSMIRKHTGGYHAKTFRSCFLWSIGTYIGYTKYVYVVLKCVYCKIKLPKVAKQKWTKLQVHFGQSCKLSHTGSREWCSA